MASNSVNHAANAIAEAQIELRVLSGTKVSDS